MSDEEKNLGDVVVDRETEQGLKTDRYGFVVFTGRHKVFDYLQGRQIATADGEDEARTIVRALNDGAEYATLLKAAGGLRRGKRCFCQTWVGGEHEPECAAMRDALTAIALTGLKTIQSESVWV